MKRFTCPSCGAAIEFQSSMTIYMVCKYCRSTLVRKDLSLESIGKMAELKNDMTPFQIGSFGHFKDNFVFIGRVQISWADGFWNEWYIRFDDGKEAWLAEAQGSYMISFAADIPKTLPKATELSPEMPIQIGSILYQVDDIKDVTYAFAEGELPFSAPQGFKGVSVDLSHGENYFASISYTESGDVDVFVGQYLEFEKFQFKNLRQIDGW